MRRSYSSWWVSAVMASILLQLSPQAGAGREDSDCQRSVARPPGVSPISGIWLDVFRLLSNGQLVPNRSSSPSRSARHGRCSSMDATAASSAAISRTSPVLTRRVPSRRSRRAATSWSSIRRTAPIPALTAEMIERAASIESSTLLQNTETCKAKAPAAGGTTAPCRRSLRKLRSSQHAAGIATGPGSAWATAACSDRADFNAFAGLQSTDLVALGIDTSRGQGFSASST